MSSKGSSWVRATAMTGRGFRFLVAGSGNAAGVCSGEVKFAVTHMTAARQTRKTYPALAGRPMKDYLMHSRRGTEVAITAPTRNRMGGNATWVRIPPSPPMNTMG